MALVVITGASRGIGRELALQLARRGDRVIAACRGPARGLADVEGIEVVSGIEVTDEAAVQRLVQAIGSRRIDVLVNNAGISISEPVDAFSFEDSRKLFEVNVLGVMRVTHALRDCLADGGKVAILTSRLGSIANCKDTIDIGYRVSKAAVNMAGKVFANALAARGIAVMLIHPGYVRTEMNDGRGDITVDVSAKGVIALIDRLSMATTGTYWHVDGNPLPW